METAKPTETSEETKTTPTESKSEPLKSGFELPEGKTVAVVVIKDFPKAADKDVVRNLSVLGLKEKFAMIFLKLNKTTIHLLRNGEKYLTYGYPSKKTIETIVKERVDHLIARKKEKLSTEEYIQRALKGSGMNTVEDLTNELLNGGEHAAKIGKFLGTMMLKAPASGFRDVEKAYVDGGDCGNREEKINELLEEMRNPQ